ncbi:phage head-tail connector protein [Bradyrhizobium septentrionale]|uniref:Phage gp6-like head-tail connector protein n=1 Tax=Bradyrhizobium septentrionale TaxID=1404411 RepID=A0ABZ2P7R1_9BRAD
MADIWVKVITEAESYDLLTLDELKLMLNINPSDTSEDAALQQDIEHYSDVVATMCNRVFGFEKVAETWRGDSMPFDCPRLFLTHYPVADGDVTTVESPRGALVDPTAYEIENRSGTMRIDGAWSEPITVTYSGGYNLPDEAPPALKQATALLIQAARMQRVRAAVAGIKSITHRESRVQFMDTNKALTSGAMGMLGDAAETVNALLYKYMRFYV